MLSGFSKSTKLSGLLGAALIFAVLTQCSPSSTSAPNVLLILVDDLGITDLGSYGSEFYETPNMDALAETSTKFNNFYSAHPVCSPTRAALMTGKAPQRVGITQWIRQPSHIHLPLEEYTIGEAFADAGYRTGYTGKWHLGELDEQMPQAQGFQTMFAVNRAGQPGSYFHPFGKEGSYQAVPDLDGSQSGDYLTDKITDFAIDFVSNQSDQPFFLLLAHYAVHTPIQSPPELVEKYKEKRDLMYTDSAPPIQESLTVQSRARQDNPAYAAMMENLDQNIGRLLDSLEKQGLMDKTIVVLTSDNGGLSTLPNRVGPTSTLPYRAGKGWNYEGGIRIPTLIKRAGQTQSKESDQLAITMDLYPSLLKMAGLETLPDQHLDGLSLSSVTSGQYSEEVDERNLAWTYPHEHGSGHRPSSAMRAGKWKLIHKIEDDVYELYNLESDPGEKIDLAKSEPAKVTELAKQLAEWLETTTPDTAVQQER